MLKFIIEILVGIILIVVGMWVLFKFSYINGHSTELVAWTNTPSILAMIGSLFIIWRGIRGIARRYNIATDYFG